jgi:hypothetical protein
MVAFKVCELASANFRLPGNLHVSPPDLPGLARMPANETRNETPLKQV